MSDHWDESTSAWGVADSIHGELPGGMLGSTALALLTTVAVALLLGWLVS